MLDFLEVEVTRPKKGWVYITPEFLTIQSSDLMVRSGKFYAIWNEEKKLWSTDEYEAIRLIDKELAAFRSTYKADPDDHVKVFYLRNSSNRAISRWHTYIEDDLPEYYHKLDETLVFANTELKKELYASKVLPYPLEKMNINCYDELMSILYSPEERHKLEWAIGAIVSGDSKKIQKFLVMYGAPKTGKSTVLNIITQLFEGYYCVFDSKALGSSSNSFALEAFASDPLVAIQHDGDLSKIEDNTRLNSLVSHEKMFVNVKFKSGYQSTFNCFLFMGTNKPVKITDAKSGIIRRLIDVSPTGKRTKSAEEYNRLMSGIEFELGGIAYHCLEVYKSNKHAYDEYVPLLMLGASNSFYDYVLFYYNELKRDDGISLQAAWEKYNEYNKYANVEHGYSYQYFKEELKNYFDNYAVRYTMEDGTRVRQYYYGFNYHKFDDQFTIPEAVEPEMLELNCTESLLDEFLADQPAQYAKEDETPALRWDDVSTDLRDIDTSRIHYVLVPENLIVIDFDLKDENGNKSFKLNAQAAAKWPKTYAELSKGGQGIHLHYLYTGDVNKLSMLYAKDIEIKVFKGKSSLRRKLTKCNDIEIASISSGLPLIKEDKVVNKKVAENEGMIRACIKKALQKKIDKIPASTKCHIDYIKTVLDNAYNSGIEYNVEDLEPDVSYFALHSTNQKDYCCKMVDQMKFKSEKEVLNNPDNEDFVDNFYTFFDIEMFPNKLIVCYKKEGTNEKVYSEVNPSPEWCEHFITTKKLVGYNCRRYDNHILHGRAFLRDTIEQCYDRSYGIVVMKDKLAFIAAAYHDSALDILDYCTNKQSLKKWEIDLKAHHRENNLRWDKPLDDKDVDEVVRYCMNDVIATELVYNATQGDLQARKILAELSGLTMNDSTNSHTTRLIFGENRRPQSEFYYWDLSQPVTQLDPKMYNFLLRTAPEMVKAKHDGHGTGPISLLPYFPGYKYEFGKSTYRGIDVGEGGLVWARPGMYGRVVTFDVASMHPHSLTSMYALGPYTENFNDLMETRIAIKHKNFDEAKKLYNGKLEPYLNDPSMAKDLAGALKIAINSVYGLTAASFENPFRDPRNMDNIVAKRGALFMVDLLNAVQERGGQVIHIKTDSIKIVDPSPELCDFVLEFGKKYGYTFEIEHIFEKICLVNNAVYIAKLAADDPDEPGMWTATGKEFAEPFVFKYLFSKEDIELDDYCQVRSVTDPASLYLDFNEGMPEGQHNYVFVGKVGSFIPVKEGCNGGYLMREKNDKYDSTNGCKGYRWKESEIVREMHYDDQVDVSYFSKLVNDAVKHITEASKTPESNYNGSVEDFMEMH